MEKKDITNLRKEWLPKCAFINLKKVPGGGSAIQEDIIKYVCLENYSDLLLGQINLLNPDIVVVCGQGLVYELNEVLFSKVRHPVVNVRHPQQRGKTDQFAYESFLRSVSWYFFEQFKVKR
jgi:hypothetical protein